MLGWTVNTDYYLVEDLKLFVAYERTLLEQKKAVHQIAAKKERKHQRRTKRGSVKSSMKSLSSELTNTIPLLTMKIHADSSFESFRQSIPSPLAPDSVISSLCEMLHTVFFKLLLFQVPLQLDNK